MSAVADGLENALESAGINAATSHPVALYTRLDKKKRVIFWNGGYCPFKRITERRLRKAGYEVRDVTPDGVHDGHIMLGSGFVSSIAAATLQWPGPAIKAKKWKNIQDAFY